AQYMVGGDYTGLGKGGLIPGDPSLGIAVPEEQFRTNYDFLTPSTYTANYVNIVTPIGAMLTLDGLLLTAAPTPIGETGFGWIRQQLVRAGPHHITGNQKFGIMVSGVAPYTSYLFAGGLNLDLISLQ